MRGRWAFRGERDSEMEERYLWKDVASTPSQQAIAIAFVHVSSQTWMNEHTFVMIEHDEF